MNFPKAVFRIAGIWGLLVLPPMFFLEERIAIDNPPAITHPEIYYGFISVALAWQLAFLVIATDPPRYRPIMIAAMAEKFLYVAVLVTLLLKGRVSGAPLLFGAVDFVLGILFVIAYMRTRTTVRDNTRP